MMVFPNRPAFTLVETIFAMAATVMVCIMLAGIFSLCIRVADQYVQRKNALLQVQNFFCLLREEASLVRPPFWEPGRAYHRDTTGTEVLSVSGYEGNNEQHIHLRWNQEHIELQTPTNRVEVGELAGVQVQILYNQHKSAYGIAVKLIFDHGFQIMTAPFGSTGILPTNKGES